MRLLSILVVVFLTVRIEGGVREDLTCASPDEPLPVQSRAAHTRAASRVRVSLLQRRRCLHVGKPPNQTLATLADVSLQEPQAQDKRTLHGNKSHEEGWKEGKPSQQDDKRRKSKEKHDKDKPPKLDEVARLEGVNRKDDVIALLHALATNAALVLAYWVVFCYLRKQFPLIYMHNALAKLAQRQAPLSLSGEGGCCSWVCAACHEGLDEVEDALGLDGAMFIEFPRFCWRVLLSISVPLLFVYWPLNCASVHNRGGICPPFFFRSELNLGPDIYWVQAGVVWFIVIAVEANVIYAQRAFAKRRLAWLKKMPPPWCTTVLVENIPMSCRTEAQLRRCFEDNLPGAVVESACIVKRTGSLPSLVLAAETARRLLAEANAKWKRTGWASDRRPTHMGASGQVDSIFCYGEELKHAEQAASASMERFRTALRTSEPGLMSSSGFVTFRCRRDTAQALTREFRMQGQSLEISSPPDPEDVVYSDLQQELPERIAMEFIGHVCIGLVFFFFIPLTVGIISITRLNTLRKYVGLFDMIVSQYPEIHHFWDGMVGSCILSLALGFVPTVFAMIFKHFFTLKSELWRQQRVQRWYFYFLMVFVLLITAVGASLAMMYLELLENPASVFQLLANSLPGASQFYLKFMMFQWACEALQLTRHPVLAKFLVFRVMYEQDRARELAEPEDQDYQGIGARSARLTLMLVIALVFSTVSPLVCPLALIHFFLCRAIYAYLLIFAEERKRDLGGVFWCTQMKHVQQGLFVYVALMVGILMERAANHKPGILAAGSFLVLVPCYIYFRTLAPETLPMEEAIACDNELPRQAPSHSYEQPELRGACR